MDEVRVERLIQKYKDNGELASEDPALVMLKRWPASKQYQDNSDRLSGLEQLVRIIYTITHMKKLPDSDWVRGVQFKCNTSVKSACNTGAKSVTPV